jgi:hypothetical protein
MKTKNQAPLQAGRNLELELAMRGKSGNLVHADRRTRRQRTRAAQNRAALRDFR